jgi:hypothetical protein
MEEQLEEENGHTHVQGPSVMCMVLMTYYNIPTDILGSRYGWRFMSSINQCIEVPVTRPAVKGKLCQDVGQLTKT